MSKPSVFLSYSHNDEKWKDRLRTQLKVLEQQGMLEVWEDRQIDGGDTWYDKIRVAMDGAEVAVCLISADYLASDFCNKEEIPYLLKRRSEQGMQLLPVLLRSCPWTFVPWLKAIQMLPRDGRSVSDLPAAKRDRAFSEVAESIGRWLAKPADQEEAVRSPSRGMPDLELETATVYRSFPMTPGSFDLEIAILPSTAIDLFGRDEELNWLDDLWEKGTVRVVSLTGPAGIGKSALANTWAERTRQEKDGPSRPIRVWDDPGSRPSSAELLGADQGFCILTSREPSAELDRLPQGLVARKELGPLSPSAGRALLRVAGVHGTDAELEEISRSLGGIPLALVRRASGIL